MVDVSGHIRFALEDYTQMMYDVADASFIVAAISFHVVLHQHRIPPYNLFGYLWI